MTFRLTLEKRTQIQNLKNRGVKVLDICSLVGIHVTTYYRELKKCKGDYSAEEAHRNTWAGYHAIDESIIGKCFGLLTVKKYIKTVNHRSWWLCECTCGNTCLMNRKILIDYCSKDRPLSCGCEPKEHKGNGLLVPFEEAALRKYKDLLAFRRVNGHCWEWTGYRHKKVPKTSWKNKGMSVRKCMYLITNLTTFEPNAVFTTCGNLLCFNPDHLTLERPKIRQFYE